MGRPDYEDGMFVCSIGSVQDRGRVIGYGFRTDATEFWMVERPDKTVFCAPSVQLSRLMRADVSEESIKTTIRILLKRYKDERLLTYEEGRETTSPNNKGKA
jgi:hypothetical protein